MDSLTTLMIILTILFVSTLLRATFGFGNALIAMPLLALMVDISLATPLVGLVSQTIAIIMLLDSWRNVQIQAAWRLILASVVGIPLGIWLLTGVSEQLVKTLLGGMLIVFSLYNLAKFRLPAMQWQGGAYLAGFLGGILGGAYNTNGPPIIVYGMLCRWTPEQFRATLQGYFVLTGVFILTSHAVAGLWTAEVLRLFGYSLPLVLLAVFVGSWLSKLIPPGRFDLAIYGFLIVMGVLLIF